MNLSSIGPEMTTFGVVSLLVLTAVVIADIRSRRAFSKTIAKNQQENRAQNGEVRDYVRQSRTVIQQERQKATAPDRYFLNNVTFPRSAISRALVEVPKADPETMVGAARSWFAVAQGAPRFAVPMPSRVADALWHALLVDTRFYADFSQRAFGTFLHHDPNEADKVDHVAAAREFVLSPHFGKLCSYLGMDEYALTKVPDLLTADHAAGLPGAPEVVVNCGGRRCRAAKQAQLVCVYHLRQPEIDAETERRAAKAKADEEREQAKAVAAARTHTRTPARAKSSRSSRPSGSGSTYTGYDSTASTAAIIAASSCSSGSSHSSCGSSSSSPSCSSSSCGGSSCGSSC